MFWKDNDYSNRNKIKQLSTKTYKLQNHYTKNVQNKNVKIQICQNNTNCKINKLQKSTV